MPSPPLSSPQVQLAAEFEFLSITFFGAVETGGKTTTILAEARNISFDMKELVQRASKEVESELAPPPATISNLKIEKIGIYLILDTETNTKSFIFSCHAKFPINDQQLDILVRLAITKQKKGYEIDFGGQIILQLSPDHALDFQLRFSKKPNSTQLSASCHQEGDRPVKVKDMIRVISEDLAKNIPPGFTLDLTEIVFLYQGGNKKKFLFRLLLKSIDLSDLELLRDVLPDDQKLSISELEFIFASHDFSSEELVGLSYHRNKGQEKIIQQGLTFKADFHLGTEVYSLDLSPGSKSTASALANSNQPVLSSSGTTQKDGNKNEPPSPVPAADADQGTKWFDVQKSIGPARFRRVGVKFSNGKLWFFLDTTLAMGPVTFSINGLGAGSPLTEFAPEFTLSGLGIHMKTSALEISGALLREEEKGKKGEEKKVSYNGMAVLKMKSFGISALGSYQPGPPASLFVFAFLDAQLGGPPFFSVNGLAAGFGYNRRFIMPDIDQVADFPLVRFAMADSATEQKDPLDTLKNATKFLPPAPGQYFLSVGIKFSSFKIINSFLLLTVSFGDQLEISMLGRSHLIFPSSAGNDNSITPIAEVTLALRAQFLPEQGFLGVEAKLTKDSYILSKKCRLTGGFAFYSWFKGEKAGDFVLTLGGYHPRFQKPSHYPTVDRLGIRWEVTKQLQIKGNMYFALCSHALMVGGRLEAVWQSDSIKVWFIAAVDFLIAWQPYSYDAQLQISIGGSYTKKTWLGTIRKSFDIGADLHIWGPDFSGTASIKVLFFSVTIRFGAEEKQPPKPINWSDFKTSFLPEDEKVCGISIIDGLVRTVKEKQSEGKEDKEISVVNPQEFALLTESVIPSTTITPNSNKVNSNNIAADSGGFGIGSMGIQHINSSELNIKITRNSSNKKEVIHNITQTPVSKNVPEALWGDSLEPDLNGKKFRKALTGCEIRPAASSGQDAKQPVSVSIDSALLAEKGTTRITEAYHWVPVDSSHLKEIKNREKEATDIQKGNPERKKLIKAFLPHLKVDIEDK